SRNQQGRQRNPQWPLIHNLCRQIPLCLRNQPLPSPSFYSEAVGGTLDFVFSIMVKKHNQKNGITGVLKCLEAISGNKGGTSSQRVSKSSDCFEKSINLSKRWRNSSIDF